MSTRHVPSCRTESDGTYSVRFLNLDWCGPETQAKYPDFMMSTQVDWPDDALEGMPILEKHDLEMAELMFRPNDSLVKEQRLRKRMAVVRIPLSGCATEAALLRSVVHSSSKPNKAAVDFTGCERVACSIAACNVHMNSPDKCRTSCFLENGKALPMVSCKTPSSSANLILSFNGWCTNLCCEVSLVDWISDTRFQGYTVLQSLVKCLDHRDIMSDTACSQAKGLLGCAIHCALNLVRQTSTQAAPSLVSTLLSCKPTIGDGFCL